VPAGAFQFDSDDAKRFPELDGLLAYSMTAHYEASSLTAPYRDAVRRSTPGAPISGIGAMAWTQGKLLEAAGAALPEPPTSAGLIDGLYRLRGETLGGLVPPITFTPGPHGRVNTCTVPIRLAAGAWTLPRGDHFVCAELK
jgi:branched-chain amino acid transport system substrate-binding protein